MKLLWIKFLKNLNTIISFLRLLYNNRNFKVFLSKSKVDLYETNFLFDYISK